MQNLRPRKPIVALLMSAVLPGFGQLYNGQVEKAIWLFIAVAFLNIPWLAFLLLAFPGRLLVPMLLLTLVAVLGLWIYGMRDARRQARLRQEYVPERWQIGGLYLLVFILCNLVALPTLTIYARAHLVESFRIPSSSMEPSLLPGDFLTADKRYNCPSCKYRIVRGDVAIFVNPNDRTLLFIKRIIALPGDRVQISGSQVSVNGQALRVSAAETEGNGFTERSPEGREWRIRADPNRPLMDEIDLVVPPGEVFVLGDNRSNSRDSRHFGTVPMLDVVGRARQIWFSWGADGVRWSRLGLNVK
jgi:signal peptidase I